MSGRADAGHGEGVRTGDAGTDHGRMLWVGGIGGLLDASIRVVGDRVQVWWREAVLYEVGASDRWGIVPVDQPATTAVYRRLRDADVITYRGRRTSADQPVWEWTDRGRALAGVGCPP